MSAWPDRDAYKAWARIPPGDTVDDAAIDAALAGATAGVLARCPSLAAAVNPLPGPGGGTPVGAAAPGAPPDPPPVPTPGVVVGPGVLLAPGPDCPDDVAQAVLLWTNRLVARRNSPTGVVGIDDTGQAVVPSRDADIARLLSPWRAAVAG